MSEEKKPFILVRMFKAIGKFFKDVHGETKKVVWTSKDELKKNTKLVLVTIVAVAAAIAVVDTLCSVLLSFLSEVLFQSFLVNLPIHLFSYDVIRKVVFFVNGNKDTSDTPGIKDGIV